MKPILFSENSTEFTSNGIGRLSDAISCVVTEERNGLYELEMVYPISGVHFPEMGIRSIIAVIPCDGGTMQAFRVYQMTKPINGKVAVYAQHISYDLSKNTCMPCSVGQSPGPKVALEKIWENAVEDLGSFDYEVDEKLTTMASYNQTTPASIRSRLGGVEGSILDQYGGEYEWDNFTVKLHSRRGTLAINNGITLRYGKNITDITQEENIAATATGVVPYWADNEGNVVTLPEKVIYSDKHKDAYSQHLTIPLDLSSNFEEQPTVEELKTAADVVVRSSEFGVPKVSIEVSFVALWQTEEYKDVAPLQRVKLCDEVMVKFEKLGVDSVAKIVKTEYDVLAERYRSVQIGSVRSSLAQTLNDQAAATIQAIAAQAVASSQAVNNATKWLTSAGGYVMAKKKEDGTWEELIFSNIPDPYDPAAKILRINNHGLGFSTGGMNGSYRNAWTIDGNLVADFITTGTMSAARIKGGTLALGGSNNGNGVLQILDANGAQIGKWDKDGISVTKGGIDGASMTLGGSSNGSGSLTVKDANGNAVVTLNNGGITITRGSTKGMVITLGGSGNGNGTLQVQNANGKNVVSIDNNGITILGGSIDISDSSGNTVFGVTAAGVVTAKSGTIGGFTIDNNTIRKGATDGTGSGAVCLSNANFKRTVAGQSKSNLRLAVSNKFGVAADGSLFCTNATVKGDLKFNQSVEIDGKEYDDAEEAIAAVDKWVSNWVADQEKINAEIDQRLKNLGG